MIFKEKISQIQSEVMLKHMLGWARDYAMYLVDPNGHILSWNIGAERLKGYKEEEVLGKHISMFYQIKEQAYSSIEKAKKLGVLEDTCFYFRKDGSIFYASISIKALKDDKGNLQGFTKIIHDSSGSSNVHELTRHLAESAPVAMIMVNQQGVILLANKQVEKLFGYSREELIGKTIEILVPERFRTNHLGFREAFFREPSARPMGAGRDLFGLKKDSTEVPIEIGLNTIKTCGETVALCSILDLTARKRAEEKFRLVVESAPNAMVMIDHLGKIALVNAQMEEVFGYDREELIGITIEVLIPARFRSQHPGMRENFFLKPQSRAMGAGRDLFGLHKDGSEVPIEIGLNPIHTDEGLFVLASIVNITERKLAAKRLEERKNALEKVNLELDSFVYTASHDLRAPLRGIENFASFLEEDFSDNLGSEGLDHLHEIRKGVDRMNRLIEDLLTLSRISRIRNPYDKISIENLIQRAIGRLEFDIKNLEIDLWVESELPYIYCDSIKLEEVFVNLINNSIKFTGKLERIPEIKIGYSKIDGSHQFYVEDNGIGIDPEFHQQIFGLFKRLQSQAHYEGTGIGLSIVHRIISEHGGKVWVESEPGAGAKFYFTIPDTLENSSL